MPKKMTKKDFQNKLDKLYRNEFVVTGEYVNSKTKIDVVHSKCGKTLNIKPNDLLNRGRCFYCNGGKRINHDEFVQQVFEAVGNEYEVIGEFEKKKNPVKMLHVKCGNYFSPQPYEFLKQGTRCPHCNNKSLSLGDSEFKKRVKELTDDTYEVLGDYVNNQTNILMRHKECGQLFEPLPKGFLKGSKCPYCSGRRSNKETFEKELFELVGDEIILVGEYVNKSHKTTFKHKKCNREFEIEPVHILKSGRRCAKCTSEENGVARRKTSEQFLEELKDIYGDEYIAMDRYVKATEKIRVKHSKCGNEWYTKPSQLLTKNTGCPSCNQSSAESEIESLLKSNNIDFVFQYKFTDCVGECNRQLPFDFALFKNGDLICIVEYDGQMHFQEVFNRESYERTVRNDAIKDKYCSENNINLIRIPYWKQNKLEQELNIILTELELV